jgi:2-phosphosulfolactate phosphatase
MGRSTGIDRIVVPSPNGSSIAFGLADQGAQVIGACLRNRSAVAALLTGRLAGGGTMAVVAAGERWPDGSLRPCAEDLWGAGAVLALLDDADLSPEARLAAAAYRAVEPSLAEALRDCASGRELIDGGFAADVDIAAELDAADVVPLLTDGEFRPATN